MATLMHPQQLSSMMQTVLKNASISDRLETIDLNLKWTSHTNGSYNLQQLGRIITEQYDAFCLTGDQQLN